MKKILFLTMAAVFLITILCDSAMARSIDHQTGSLQLQVKMQGHDEHQHQLNLSRHVNQLQIAVYDSGWSDTIVAPTHGNRPTTIDHLPANRTYTVRVTGVAVARDGTTRIALMQAEGQAKILPGKKTHLHLALKPLSSTAIRLVVNGLSGKFGEQLDVQTVSTAKSGSELKTANGFFADGQAVIMANVQIADPVVALRYELKDKENVVYIQKLTIDLHTLIDKVIADGFYEVTFANSSDSTVEVIIPPVKWNDLFLPYVTRPIGSFIEAIEIADINGDGHNDVVLITSYYFNPDNDCKIMIFLNDGNGSLLPPIKHATSGRPSSLAIGDLNGDGQLDILVGSTVGLEFFYNLGGGSFGPAGRYLIETRENVRVRIADLNNDGRLDIACVGWSTNLLEIYTQGLGQAINWFSGSGPFTKTTYSVKHGGWEDLAIVDFDMNGQLDIVVMSGQGFESGLNIMFQNNEGFAPPVHYFFNAPRGLTVGDVNDDGRPELIVASGGNRPLSLIYVLSKTSSGFGLETLPSYDIPWSIKTTDLNGDGKTDIAVAHEGWMKVGAYLQKDGLLQPEQLYQAPTNRLSPETLAVGDLNGDGLPDIVTVYLDQLSILYSIK